MWETGGVSYTDDNWYNNGDGGYNDGWSYRNDGVDVEKTQTQMVILIM